MLKFAVVNLFYELLAQYVTMNLLLAIIDNMFNYEYTTNNYVREVG